MPLINEFLSSLILHPCAGQCLTWNGHKWSDNSIKQKQTRRKIKGRGSLMERLEEEPERDGGGVMDCPACRRPPGPAGEGAMLPKAPP